MGNMGYCRFENTVGDLGECQLALENMLDCNEAQLSKTERSKARELIRTCHEILMLVQEHSGLDTEEFMDKMELNSDRVIDDFLDVAQESAEAYGS